MFWTAASAANTAASIPDLSGLWAREYIGFEPPSAGQGPITNMARIPTGQSRLGRTVGNYTDPILKASAAAILKARGGVSLSGQAFPDPSNQCALESPPYIFWQQQIQLLQQRDQVIILYQHSHQARHVRLNARHPENPVPSWSGDSIGHYEGDTLVVDTVGIKVGPLSMVDFFGTPQSPAVHVIERYRLIDYDAAIDALKTAEKEHIRLRADDPIGDGVGVDGNYRGPGLQLQFTVEDPNEFNGPWSAKSTFLRASGDWVERICAENIREYYANRDTAIAVDNTPDF
jgi:hypothetical protein